MHDLQKVAEEEASYKRFPYVSTQCWKSPMLVLYLPVSPLLCVSMSRASYSRLRVGKLQQIKTVSRFSVGTPPPRNSLANGTRAATVFMAVESVEEALHTLWLLVFTQGPKKLALVTRSLSDTMPCFNIFVTRASKSREHKLSVLRRLNKK